MRLLVTGGAGYVGSVVAAMLVEAGHDVTVVDDLTLGHRDAVPPGARFVYADLLDREAVRSGMASGFDAVLHFAARSLVGESIAEPTRYFRHNVNVAVNLLDAMRADDVPRIVFSSTAAVYGEPDTVPIPEDAPTLPTNPYGASKLAVDQLLGFAVGAYGLSATSLRYFNVAGAYGPFGERHDPETHLIPRLLAAASGTGPGFELYGTDYPTPDGTAVRDYIHVCDLAEAHLRALEAPVEPGSHQIYNLGNGEGFSVREVLAVAREVTGARLPAQERDRRPGDPARLVASSKRARAELGWQPSRGELGTIIADAWSFHRARSAA
jgi:UDP-glucose 4-epimerase